MEWYWEESRKYVPYTEREWVFKEQLLEYCIQDCEVLRAGCKIYRDAYMSHDIHEREFDEDEWIPHPLDPFCYMTAPQVNQQWQLYGMPNAQVIANTPYIRERKGYTEYGNLRQSKVAMEWLAFEQQRKRRELNAPDFTIITAYNNAGREAVISVGIGKPYKKVDGYCEYGGQKYVFEFYGCYWHGCPKCNRDKIANGEKHPTSSFLGKRCTTRPSVR